MLRDSLRGLMAWLLIGLGIIVTPLPIPFGIIMIVCGLSLLVSTSPAAREKVRWLRARHRGFSSALHKAQRYLPGFAKRLILATEPHPNTLNKGLPRQTIKRFEDG